MPRVSVVIPSRNRWPLLEGRALRSALGQQGVDHEVIVVDDGSVDETSSRLDALAAREQRLRAIRHDEARGVAAARNTGLEAAAGAWVAFLDDDDAWSPHKLALQVAAAERDGSAWVYAGALAVDEAGRPLYEYYFPDPQRIARQLGAAAVVPGGASNVVVRTDVVRAVGGFDERFRHVEDWDLWIRLSEAGAPTAVRDVLVAVYFHRGSKHAINDQADEIDRLIRKHAGRTPPRRLDVDRLGHGRWVAGEHSRAGLHWRAARLYARDALRYRAPTNLLRALDALTAKRFSAALLRRPQLDSRPAVAAPGWLSTP